MGKTTRSHALHRPCVVALAFLRTTKRENIARFVIIELPQFSSAGFCFRSGVFFSPFALHRSVLTQNIHHRSQQSAGRRQWAVGCLFLLLQPTSISPKGALLELDWSQWMIGWMVLVRGFGLVLGVQLVAKQRRPAIGRLAIRNHNRDGERSFFLVGVG